MKSLKGTQTEKNILTAFAGESQARNRYDFFAAKAKSDGYVLVRDIFQETALQEKEHAKRLFKFLEGGDVEIVGAFPAGIIGATEANLLASAAGENHEHTEMYPSFAAVAEKEGFSEIAAVMRNIAVAEAYHEKRFLALARTSRKAACSCVKKPPCGAAATAVAWWKVPTLPICARPVPIPRPTSKN